MNMKLRLAVFAMIAVPFATGCFIIPQDAVDDIKDDITNELPQSKNTLRIDAIADGSGKTHVIACVADPVVCVNADGPFAAAMGSAAAVDLPFVVDYMQNEGVDVGRFRGDLTGDAAESEIKVTRKGDAATTSTATLPPAALPTAPMEGATISLATDQIKLTWDTKGGSDPMEWAATVECGMPAVEVVGTSIEDTGEHVVDPAKLNLKAGETCKVTLHLSRFRDGTIEKAFQDGGRGLITAKQTRSVTVNVGP
ncbi:MAG: hypothetical protein IPM54_23580 [Polyangiaceae bacterium]|nr:hypothetical protein [Polyangiaceae bacterium]